MSDINQEKLKKSTRNSTSAKKISYCALFVVLMIVSAFIKIPFPLVPLTFQTVVAVLAGLTVGAWWGAAAVFVYVFMGLIGLPVFAGGGGFAYVLQPSFGYIVGFVAAAFFAGSVRGNKPFSQGKCILAALVGFAVNYAVGMPYFAVIWHFYLGNGNLLGAIVTYNLLYMPKDLVLCFLSALLAYRLRFLYSERL